MPDLRLRMPRWAYLLGRNALSLQRNTQRDMRRMLWIGVEAVQDLMCSDSGDEDEEARSFQVQSAQGPADADKNGAATGEMNEEDEVLPPWGELPGENVPQMPQGQEVCCVTA